MFDQLTQLEPSFSLEDLIELGGGNCNLNDDFDSQLETLDRLHMALSGLSDEQKECVLSVLVQCDPSVEAIIGSQSSEFIENFEAFHDAALEGFWQDFLRWGPFGSLIGLYLQSFGRIRKCCNEAINDGIDQNKMHNWTARSLYLPDASEFFKAMDGLQALYDAMSKAAKNLKSFEPKQLFDKLKGTGIACTEKEVNGVKKFDWKAIAGSFLGSFAVGFVQGFLTTAGAAAVGNTVGLLAPLSITVGAHKWSDKGGKLGDRGWDADKMIKAAKIMIKMVDQGEKLKNINGAIDLQGQDKLEYKYKIDFLKKCGKVYLEDVKEVGRGLASAIYHVKN